MERWRGGERKRWRDERDGKREREGEKWRGKDTFGNITFKVLQAH